MYERQYTRIDTVRQILDEKLNAIEDAENRRCPAALPQKSDGGFLV